MTSLIIEPELTQAQKAAISIDKRRLVLLQQFKTGTQELFRDFWFPVNGITSQEIADVFSENCCKAFDQHAETIQFLLSQGINMDESSYIPPREYARNENGTITIAQEITEEII